MNVPAILALVALSLQAASATGMFLIARVPGWERVRPMGFIALSAGGYSAVNVWGAYQMATGGTVRWVFDINLAIAAVHSCMWVWYTFSDAAGTWGSVPRRLKWLGVGPILVAGAAAPFHVVATPRTSPGTVQAIARDASFVNYELTVFGNLLAALVLGVLAVCFVTYVQRARRGEPGTRGIVTGFALFGVCLIEEVLVAAGVVDFYYLADVGYVFIVVPLAAQLLRRFSDDARRLAALSSRLADEVEQRTQERDTARESLVEQQRLAALGRLAAGVGHEINNPLQYLLFNLEELRPAVAASPSGTVHASLDQAFEGADRIRRVVESLRRYGTDTGGFTPVDLHAVVQAALRIASPQLRRAATIRTELGAVPPVLGDEGKLVQILVNPLVNAVQALARHAGEQEAHVLVATRTDGSGNAEISISDNGPGFAADILPRLGEPYVTTRADSGGTGLGLFVTHGLVAAHGGSLTLENGASGGAVVRIRLPAARREERPATPAAPVDGSVAPVRVPRRVLVVDDEPALVSVLERGLTRLGHHVTTARDGEAALTLIEETPFDVVLSDLMMPNLSGVAFAALLAERRPALRKCLVIMTGGAVTPEDAAFLAREDTLVIEKPVRLAQLAATIDGLPVA